MESPKNQAFFRSLFSRRARASAEGYGLQPKGMSFSRRVRASAEGYGLQPKGTGFSPYITPQKTSGFSPRGNAIFQAYLLHAFTTALRT
jgi:hypothetical protein